MAWCPPAYYVIYTTTKLFKNKIKANKNEEFEQMYLHCANKRAENMKEKISIYNQNN
jgi:hypothetical protein